MPPLYPRSGWYTLVSSSKVSAVEPLNVVCDEMWIDGWIRENIFKLIHHDLVQLNTDCRMETNIIMVMNVCGNMES